MVLETPKPRRRPMAPPPPKLEEALRQKLAEAVGDDATSYINSFRRCGRCGKACDSSKCIVEHPAHLRRDRGATFSFSSYESCRVRRVRRRVQGGRRREERRHIVVQICG